MKNLKSTARKLDILFNVMQVLFTIAAVAALVVLLLIAACFVFRLDPEQIGTGYNALDLGFLELELAEAFAPDKHRVLIMSAADIALGFVAAVLGRFAMVRVRCLLKPMKQGSPFHADAAADLKKLAVLSLAAGIVINISRLVNYLFTSRCYGLQELFLSEKIIHVNYSFDLDLTFLVISGILLMLSYIFRYGQQLQQLSDETL